MTYPREAIAAALRELAGQGIYLGTSSWKYPGWLGLLYTPERYQTRGKISRAKFNANCLAEYAEVFPTVCLDAGFYQFPPRKMIDGLMAQVPRDFRLTLKVTEDITVRRFPALPRYGRRAGARNDRFLDAGLFASHFLAPLEPHRERIGALVFEFRFHAGDWARGRDFVEALDLFLGRLPKGWDYSVEIRNESLLRPEYFAALRRHGVAHTFNNWSRMPAVAEQIELPDSFTADFATARFLLKPGRNFEQAVEKFRPYSEVKEPYPEARAALIKLLTLAPGTRQRRYLYVNNRLEGCSLWTIYAALSGLLSAVAKARLRFPAADQLASMPPGKNATPAQLELSGGFGPEPAGDD